MKAMADQVQQPLSEPSLVKRITDPKGVIGKNLKPMLYVAAAMLVIGASIISGTPKKSAAGKNSASGLPPQPLLTDSTETNVLDLNSHLAAAKEISNRSHIGDQVLTGQQPEIPATAAPCTDSQSCPSRGTEQTQLTPAQQEVQQLAARDRALDFDSRFASNLVFARATDTQAQKAHVTEAIALNPGQAATQNSVHPEEKTDPVPTRKPEVNVDSALGQPYVLYEGTTLDTVLMNRLDGDAAGPVKVLVSNPVYSHDRQHQLIPEGTVALGEARKVGSTGFGQQRRIALVFHRMIMPDGYSVDLDQFHGLDQIGEEGAKDKVNNHYLEIFGTSIALGLVAGAGQIEQGGGALTTSGSQAFTTGAAANISQSASTVLDRFLAIPPTLTIREGNRIKLYFTQDMLLPAYENHKISSTF
jgi:type IV secretion system protein VirB10